MKVLFVGPTFSGHVRHGSIAVAPGIAVRGPAAQGDVFRAVREGAAVIGIIDGRYEDVAAPWHKEILFALQSGVTVFGGGSLGALRAAECDTFGMIGVGRIYEQYRDGLRVDDADVAQVHGPEELDYLPLSEPVVNIEATIAAMLEAGAIDPALAGILATTARRIFFKQLSIDSLLRQVALATAVDIAPLQSAFRAFRVDQKQRDGWELVAAMQVAADARGDFASHWQVSESRQWRHFIERASGQND